MAKMTLEDWFIQKTRRAKKRPSYWVEHFRLVLSEWWYGLRHKPFDAPTEIDGKGPLDDINLSDPAFKDGPTND